MQRLLRCVVGGGDGRLFALLDENGGESCEDDSDMKIAPERPSHRTDEQPQQSEELNELFQEVVENRQNGNREKAIRLGQELACDAASPDGKVLSGSNKGESPLLTSHRKILFAFVMDQVMDTKAANPLVAEVVSNSFYKAVERQFPQFYQELRQYGAFTLYLLCSRERPPQGYGKAFAELVRRPEDPEIVRLGDTLYREYVQYVEEKIAQTAFIP